jgi:hypothetical protein
VRTTSSPYLARASRTSLTSRLVGLTGIIEKSALEGQRSYQREIDRAMRIYIQEHQTEFIPAGLDPAAVAVAVQVLSVSMTPMLPSRAAPRGEQERNQRGLQ